VLLGHRRPAFQEAADALSVRLSGDCAGLEQSETVPARRLVEMVQQQCLGGNYVFKEAGYLPRPAAPPEATCCAGGGVR